MISLRKKIFCVVAACAFSLSRVPFCYAIGTDIVFDPTNWLAAIDSLYKTYDMVNSQITMIQQNYEQIQHAIDQAKSWKFEEIKWDGDLDFRNEIANATSQVNKGMNNIQALRNDLTDENLYVNGHRYSFADLCGYGTLGEDGKPKSLKTYINDMIEEEKVHREKAGQALTKGVTEDEAKWLWQKYGLSPSNYELIVDTKALFEEQIGLAMQKLRTDTKTAEEDANKNQEITNTLNQMAEGKDGEITPTQAAQDITFSVNNVKNGLDTLDFSIKTGISAILMQNAQQKSEKEMEEELNERMEEEIYKEWRSRKPEIFWN